MSQVAPLYTTYGNVFSTFKVECALSRGYVWKRYLIKVDDKVSRDVMVMDHCPDAIWKVNCSSAKNWAEGSNFPAVPFRLAQSIHFKTPLNQLSVSVILPPNSERPLPIEITIFQKITAPISLISFPIIASYIFTSNSSPTNSSVRRVTWSCVIFWRYYEMIKNSHAHLTARSVHSYKLTATTKHFWGKNICKAKSQLYELSLT